ncbi:MAG: type II secretion system protein GspF [Gammaproteobacteria bacterium]|nr:type II secretion system protein GspF [Gammaproteobacteria bacterium]
MSAFEYSAVDARGRTVKGVAEGGSARHVRDQLRGGGLTPLQVEPLVREPVDRGSATRKPASTQVPQPDAVSRPRRVARLSHAEYTLFLRLLGSLLEAGLELEVALRTAQRQAGARAQVFYGSLIARILEGMNLSQALRAMGNVPRLGIAAIAAAERAGQLAAVLVALADHGERREYMRNKVMMALLYPAILTLVSVGVALALVTYVVPEVARVFEGYRAELPLMTRALLASSDFLNTYGAALAVLGVVVVVCISAARHSPAASRVYDRIAMATPGLRWLRRAVERERFLDTLAMLLAGGVPLVEAMRGAADVLQSELLRAGAEQAIAQARRGQTLAAAMGPSGLLSPVTLQLVSAGEQSARLEDMLMRAAHLEGAQLERRVATSLALLEPVLILVMGVMVLAIVLAILLPIFELNTLIT